MQSANLAEFEEVRREGAQFMQLLASHVGQAASAADAATQHVTRLSRELALSVEETRGRFEALAVAQSDIPQIRLVPCTSPKLCLSLYMQPTKRIGMHSSEVL